MRGGYDLPDESSDAGQPVPDGVVDLFDSLSSVRRCAIVHVLNDRSPLAEDELAARLVDLRAAAETRREQVHVTLRHRHLPKLADAGVVEYEPDDGLVDCGPAFDAAAATLEEASTHH